MIQNLLKNWKTTSAGALLLIGSSVHLIFMVKQGKGDEATWTASLTACLTGIGLIFAGDASKSKEDADQLNQKIDITTKAVVTGDTSTLAKPSAEEQTATK
jgi:hypothetical protein